MYSHTNYVYSTECSRIFQTAIYIPTIICHNIVVDSPPYGLQERLIVYRPVAEESLPAIKTAQERLAELVVDFKPDLDPKIVLRTMAFHTGAKKPPKGFPGITARLNSSQCCDGAIGIVVGPSRPSKTDPISLGLAIGRRKHPQYGQIVDEAIRFRGRKPDSPLKPRERTAVTLCIGTAPQIPEGLAGSLSRVFREAIGRVVVFGPYQVQPPHSTSPAYPHKNRSKRC